MDVGRRRGHGMKETIELDEGYWQALLLDAEACRPEAEPERSAERAASGHSAPARFCCGRSRGKPVMPTKP